MLMLNFPGGLEEIIAAMHKGMADCYPERYTRLGANLVMTGNAPLDRVAVIVSGGGGGEPQFAGYAAPGLADAACTGNFRAAPNAYALYEAGKVLGEKRGVLFVYNNFAGDFLNNDMAAELLELDGIASKSVLMRDDIASARGEPREARGGLCGILFALKVAAEASRRGLSLDDCHRLAEKAGGRTGSISLVDSAEDGDVMIGSGFSGEPPLIRTADRDASVIARTVSGMLLDDIKIERSEQVEIIVSRMNGTTYMESFAFASLIREALLARGHSIRRIHVGGYFNPISARGYFLSVLRADDELGDLLGGTVETDSFSF